MMKSIEYNQFFPRILHSGCITRIPWFARKRLYSILHTNVILDNFRNYRFYQPSLMDLRLKKWIKAHTPFRVAFILTLLYVFFSFIFIFAGDQILLLFPGIDSVYELTGLQSLKAFIYLVLSGSIFYILAFNFLKWLAEAITSSGRSLEKYQQIVETVNDGIFIINDDHSITFSNAQASELLGYSLTELTGKLINDIMVNEETGNAENLKNLVKGQQSDARLKLMGKQGNIIITDVSANKLKSPNGNPDTLLVLRNLTEIEKMETELELTRKKFQKVVEMAPFGIIITRNGIIEFGNEAILNIFSGQSMNEYIGRPIYEFVHPEYLELIKKRQKILSAENSRTEFTRIKALKIDGTTIDIEIAGTSFRINDEIYTESIIKDITELKKAEDALKKSEERFREAIMNSPFPIMIHSEEGKIIDVNRSWQKRTGYSAEEIPDIDTWTEKAFKENTDKFKKMIFSSYETKEIIDQGEFTIVTKKGNDRTWHMFSAPLLNIKDERQFTIFTAMDITDKKVIEYKLEEHQKNLEALVNTRTRELEEKNAELERVNKLFVGREFRIKELKDTIGNLEKEIKGFQSGDRLRL